MSSLNVSSGQSSTSRQRRKIVQNTTVGGKTKKLKVSVLGGPSSYKKSGLANTLHGNIYQLKLLMLFLKRGLKKGYSFRLATEIDSAEKFDDLVFKYENETQDGFVYRFLQAKHKLDDKKIKITKGDLISDKDKDFSLQKYFNSYLRIKHKYFENAVNTLQDLVLCTNIDFDDFLKNSATDSNLNPDDILISSAQNSAKPARFLKLDLNNCSFKDDLKNVFEKMSDFSRLTKELAAHTIQQEEIGLGNSLFKMYHSALTKYVVDVETGKFKESFLNRKNKQISNFKKFQDAFKTQIERCKYEWKKVKNINVKFSKEYTQYDQKNISPKEKMSNLPYCVTDENIAEFFDKLIFAVNQPNEIVLGNIIEQEIGTEFSLMDSELIASNFQRFMLDWMKTKEGQFISHEDGGKFFDKAKEKLAKLLLIGCTLNYREKVAQLGLEFSNIHKELDNFLSNNTDKQVFNLIVEENTILGSVKVYSAIVNVKINGESPYKDNDSYIFMGLNSLLRLQEDVIRAFQSENGNHLLVIECKAPEMAAEGLHLYDQLVSILEKHAHKKVILITLQTSTTLADKFRKISSTVKYDEKEDKNNSLVDLKPSTQATILSNGIVAFQGVNVNLGSVVDDKTKRLVDELTLTKLINGDVIKIGNSLSDLGEIEAYYIDRTFKRQIVVQPDCFKKHTKDMFVFSKEEKSEMFNLFSNNMFELRENRFEKCKVLGDVDEETGNRKFDKICENHPGRTVHWFEKHANCYNWKKSIGSLANLRQFVDEQCTSEFLPKSVADINDKVVIITAEPGMGKSTVLTNLVRVTHFLLRKRKSKLWIVKINLSDHTKYLSKMNFNTIEEVVDFILEVVKTESNNKFESELLKHFILTRGNIVVLFDGFDEISPNYKDKVIQLIRILCNTKVEKIWITTRPHMRNVLEDNFSSFSYTLKPLTKKDQETFLQKFWSHSLKIKSINVNRVKIYTDKLLDLLSHSIFDKERELTGIPLQTRMVAEAFENNFNEFYFSNAHETNIPSKWNLVDLYRTFVEKKYEIYRKEKKQEDSSRVAVADDTLDLFSLFQDRHKKMAVYTLFEENWQKQLFSQCTMEEIKLFISRIVDGKEKTGIIIEVIDDKVRFIHRTFAEYFAALWFVDELKNEKVKNFYKENIFADQYGVLRNFIDRILAGNIESHNAAINNDSNSTCLSVKDDCRDNQGRTWLHLAASYGHDNILKTLDCDKNDNLIILDKKDEIFGWTAIKYAAKCCQWSSVDILLKNGANAEDMRGINTRIEDARGCQPIHLAASHGLENVVDALLKQGVKINIRDNCLWTPLHWAAESDHLPMVKFLVKNHADITAFRDDGWVPLINAIYADKFEIVKFLIESGADVNKIDFPRQFSPLHWAISRRCITIAELLVKNDETNIHLVDKEKNSALNMAAARGFKTIVELLISKGANANNVGKNGQTPLHMAAYNGHFDIVKYFIEGEHSKIDAKDTKGGTALHLAALGGEVEIVEYLVDKGLDLQSENNNKWTLLHYAVWGGNLKMVQYLVERGANILQKNNYDAVLHRAVTGDDIHVLQFILSKIANMDCSEENINVADNAGDSPLMWAVETGRVEATQLILEFKDVNINLQNKAGETALHWAAKEGHSNCAILLLNKNVNPNIKNNDGFQPLHVALQHGHENIVEVLLEKGATVDARDNCLWTPLHRAAELGYINSVKLLIKKGINVNAVRDDGWMPLINAIYEQKFEVIKFLVVNGTDINQMDTTMGYTPLHWAIARNNPCEVFEFLLSYEADPNIQDNEKSMPLHLATEKKNIDVVKCLLNYGADVNAKNRYNMNSLEIALRNGNLEIAKLFTE